MLWARLYFVCTLAIEVTALMESLKMRALSWFEESALNIASSMAKVSAVYMLEKGSSLWRLFPSVWVMAKPVSLDILEASV